MRSLSPPKRALRHPFVWCATTTPCSTCASPDSSPAVKGRATPAASFPPPWTANAAPKHSRLPSRGKHLPFISTFARGECMILRRESALAAGVFFVLRPMARFRSIAIFSPWASVLFRFAALPLGFPSLFPLGRLVSSSVSFGASSLSFFALLLDLFFPSCFFFPPCSVAANRLCFARRKNAYLSPPSRARVMRPRVPCFE